MPIARGLRAVLDGELAPDVVGQLLMTRQLRNESE